jgi:hypothetical protein
VSNIGDALKVEHLFDVDEIRNNFHLCYSDYEIEKLWEAFSDTYAAGWLIVDEETLQNFRGWLEV